MNEVRIWGHLGADPELRQTNGGPVINLRVATKEPYKDKDGKWQTHTEWHNVALWGARAESLAKILRSGSAILVSGALRTHSYDKSGEKRYKTEIKAFDIVLTDRRQSNGDENEDADPSPPCDGNNQRGGGGYRQSAPASSSWPRQGNAAPKADNW